MANTGMSRLATIAHLMQALRRAPDAKMFYELLSDSLMWTDEIPEADATHVGGLRSLRYVFRYRTGLMLGAVEERYRPFWDEAMTLFPAWPGFDPERRAATLRDIYHSFREEAKREMEDLFGGAG